MTCNWGRGYRCFPPSVCVGKSIAFRVQCMAIAKEMNNKSRAKQQSSFTFFLFRRSTVTVISFLWCAHDSKTIYLISNLTALSPHGFYFLSIVLITKRNDWTRKRTNEEKNIRRFHSIYSIHSKAFDCF